MPPSAPPPDAPGSPSTSHTPAADLSLSGDPPASPWVPVTPDGGVMRRVVEAGGAGARPPPLHGRCLVHYTGFILPDAEATSPPPTATPFFSTHDEGGGCGGGPAAPAVVIAGRTAAAREAGLAAAVAAMAVGERAHVRVTPPYGYGAAGSFSFPSVPPNAHLFYDVHLLAAEPPDEGKPLGAMLFEERVEAAARRRAAGNAALASGDADAAVAAYSLALSFIDDDLLIQLEGRHAELAEAEVRAARLNLAAAHLGAGRHREAAAACDAVLAVSPSTCPPVAKAKALYRRGLARRALGAPGDAVADLKAAAAAAPGDRAIRAALTEAVAEAKAQEAAGAAVFKGALRRRRQVEEQQEGVVTAPAPVQRKTEVQAGAAGWGAAAAAAAAALLLVAVAAAVFAVAKKLLM